MNWSRFQPLVAWLPGSDGASDELRRRRLRSVIRGLKTGDYGHDACLNAVQRPYRPNLNPEH